MPHFVEKGMLQGNVPLDSAWNYYYGQKPRSFGEHSGYYEHIIRTMASRYPSILDISQIKTLVLGGFHPFNGTPEDFKNFCFRIHPNPSIIYLDMNRLPLEAASGGHAVQARVEYLPFQPSVIDFLFLDFTVDYMNDEELKRLSHSSSVSLSPNGLMIIAKTFPPGLKKMQRDHPQLTLHPRYISELITTMANLKLVMLSIGYDSSLVIMAREDSPFEPHTPSPSDLSEEYPWPK